MSFNESVLNDLHHEIVLPINDMFLNPIQDGMLNRSTLIGRLNNLKIQKKIDNYRYYCFTELNLNNLNLKNIDMVGDFKSLRKLVLRQNSIEDLSALNNLNNLEYLDVSQNCLKLLLNFNPPNMLRYVNSSNNNIELIDNVSDFWSLTYLDLSHNDIKIISGLQELKYLTFLNLSHNCIKQISNYSLPCTLVEINLSYNDLEDIKLDMSLSMCEILNVSHNKLKLLNFLKNAKQLSVLSIQNNMIDDILQIANLKTLNSLRIISAENNEFFKANVHEQIFSNNLPSKSIVDRRFIKIDELQEFNEMTVYSMLKAKKNAMKSTVLEHLSGKCPIASSRDCSGSYNCRSYPMVILVGPPKTRKKYILNQIVMKHGDKFYQAFIYTTNNILCKDKIFKTITTQEFNRMDCTGEFVFSYRCLGHFYGLSEDQLSKCTNENKILITFTSLEGALSLKLKGYSPKFVLILPENEFLYHEKIYKYIKNIYMNQNNPVIGNKDTLKKEAEKILIGTKNSLKPTDNFTLESFSVCSLSNTDDETLVESEIISKVNNDIEDDPCIVYTNECINNLHIYYNLYEKSTDIFHSLIYVDNTQNALNEIIKIMIDVHNEYRINQNSETQKPQNKHTLAYIYARHQQLCNEFFE